LAIEISVDEGLSDGLRVMRRNADGGEKPRY
jgi:hypothetical protein